MNYDDMPAGPEMDRMIAERVMGWTLTGRGHPEIDQGNWIDASGRFHYCGLNSFLGLAPFNPCANIAHAWEVVEKLRERFTRVEVHSVMKSYVCQVEKDSGETTESYVADAEADTAPIAICRAALKAMGAQ